MKRIQLVKVEGAGWAVRRWKERELFFRNEEPDPDEGFWAYVGKDGDDYINNASIRRDCCCSKLRAILRYKWLVRKARKQAQLYEDVAVFVERTSLV